MSYISRGRRPIEYASKSSHSNLVKDESIKKFLSLCSLPKRADEIEIGKDEIVDIPKIKKNPIKNFISIDGGYSEIPVVNRFPSSTLCFFQFGALFFRTSDLEELSIMPFIDPEDMSKLKEIQRIKFILPVKNIRYKGEASLTLSVRKAVYDFFMEKPNDDRFIKTLKWFLFEEYLDKSLNHWNLANCPSCKNSRITLNKDDMSKEYTFKCPHCGDAIYLTDVFRLHEAIDDELGAGGILGYVTSLMEQMMLVHLIRLILKVRPIALKETLFIKDGPLAFFGQTANMHEPMNHLIQYLFKKHDLYLIGLEKTGTFVEHAAEIAKTMSNGSIILLSNEYIYKYIIPAKADINNPYGISTYYGCKVIFKTTSGYMYVGTIPVDLPIKKVLESPKLDYYKNLPVTLFNVEKLKCDMYDSAVIPIALVNKLVSLADHPSSIVLEKFAKDSMIK